MVQCSEARLGSNTSFSFSLHHTSFLHDSPLPLDIACVRLRLLSNGLVFLLSFSPHAGRVRPNSFPAVPAGGHQTDQEQAAQIQAHCQFCQGTSNQAQGTRTTVRFRTCGNRMTLVLAILQFLVSLVVFVIQHQIPLSTFCSFIDPPQFSPSISLRQEIKSIVWLSIAILASVSLSALLQVDRHAHTE